MHTQIARSNGDLLKCGDRVRNARNQEVQCSWQGKHPSALSRHRSNVHSTAARVSHRKKGKTSSKSRGKQPAGKPRSVAREASEASLPPFTFTWPPVAAMRATSEAPTEASILSEVDISQFDSFTYPPPSSTASATPSIASLSRLPSLSYALPPVSSGSFSRSRSGSHASTAARPMSLKRKYIPSLDDYLEERRFRRVDDTCELECCPCPGTVTSSASSDFQLVPVVSWEPMYTPEYYSATA